MQSDMELDRLRQENRAKSHLLEKANLYAQTLHEKNVELNRRVIFLDNECRQLEEKNRQLMDECTKDAGFMSLLHQLIVAFKRAVARRILVRRKGGK